jgi:hypothetical protein
MCHFGYVFVYRSSIVFLLPFSLFADLLMCLVGSSSRRYWYMAFRMGMLSSYSLFNYVYEYIFQIVLSCFDN